MMMTKVNIGVSFNKLSECYPLSQQWESLFTDANISRKSIMIGLSYPKRVSASFSLLTASPGTFSFPWSRCISIPLSVFRYVLVVVNQCLNHLRPFLIIKCFFLTHHSLFCKFYTICISRFLWQTSVQTWRHLNCKFWKVTKICL